MIRFLLWLLCAACVFGCSPLSKSALTKKFKSIDEQLQDHTGFMLYDLEKKQSVFEYNASKYFTPASNTKIFTFFSGLKILGDSVPAFHYRETADSLILWGTGNPSFLYKYVYNNGRVYNFLKNAQKPLYFSSANFYSHPFGPGWAWDDFNDYYAAERSAFPIYGNIFYVKLENNSPRVYPAYFQKYFSQGPEKERTQVQREVNTNHFTFHWGKRRTSTTVWDVPIRMEEGLDVMLLCDTLKKAISVIEKHPFDSSKLSQNKTFYSIPTDSIYKVLMQDSDNFIAEQILMMCSDVLNPDTTQTEITINYVKKNFLKDLKDAPSWVDGSGLSRYNLFTPRTIVQMWEKIYQIRPRERLFPLLATGGVSGTIKNWYKGDTQPYIFGKTGSLSNVHCLSGYLITRSGKTLIFSFMNNNFVESTSKVRTHMQDLLKMIYEKY
jgi:serine-type D-Ala-D-Ala carboxypeptidase/endopeptidase (penicillin-binding protein 4)